MASSKKMVQDWLKFSRQDIVAAKILFESKNEFIFSNIGFHCQQSVEKSLKAFLVFHDIKFSKTHDIRSLSLLIPNLDDSFKEKLILANDLTPFAVIFRYPDAATKNICLDDIKTALKTAEMIYNEITSKIPFDFSLPETK